MTDLVEIDRDKVSLSVDDQKVAGTLLRPEAPVPGFLFIHGWGGDQAEDLGHAEELARLGCICFTFDLRGHAESDADKRRILKVLGDSALEEHAEWILIHRERSIDEKEGLKLG